MKTYEMLINGALGGAISGETIGSINPATGEVVARAAWGGEEDATAAVDAAEAARGGWRDTSVGDRSKLVSRLASRLRERAGDLATLETADTGNPINVMTGDVFAAAGALDYFAGLGTELKGHSVPSTAGGLRFTLREPYGVVVKIIPFNHPIMFSGAKIAAPLMAGNTVVLKPPPQAPLSALLLAELAADVFPAGVLNVVPGPGATVGHALVTDSRVRRIGFTGSVETGKVVMREASAHLADVSLELGGKNPLIVFPDADVEHASEAAVAAMNFTWQGQSCGSASRLFVHRSMREEFVDRLVERVEALKVGLPDNVETEMGAIISSQQLERIMSYIEAGKQEGARLLTGGEQPRGDDFARGYWIAPTVFVDVTPQMRIAREEIFGPVLSVFEWEHEEEVIRLANDTEYGLTANIWTRDLNTALRVIPQLEAGYTWVNGRTEHFQGLPFGGHKQSGQGSEEGLEELLSYTQTKSISMLPGR